MDYQYVQEWHSVRVVLIQIETQMLPSSTQDIQEFTLLKDNGYQKDGTVYVTQYI